MLLVRFLVYLVATPRGEQMAIPAVPDDGEHGHGMLAAFEAGAVATREFPDDDSSVEAPGCQSGAVCLITRQNEKIRNSSFREAILCLR